MFGGWKGKWGGADREGAAGWYSRGKVGPDRERPWRSHEAFTGEIIYRSGDVERHPGPTAQKGLKVAPSTEEDLSRDCSHGGCQGIGGVRVEEIKTGAFRILCEECAMACLEGDRTREGDLREKHCEGCKGDYTGSQNEDRMEENRMIAARHPHGKVWVELYCGSCPMIRAARQRYGTGCSYIGVDKIPQGKLERRHSDLDLSTFLARPEVLYVQFDCDEVTERELEVWCRAVGRKTEDIEGFSCSPGNKEWINAGEPSGWGGTSATNMLSQEAVKVVNSTITLVKKVHERIPKALIVVEHPWHGLVLQHRRLQELTEVGSWMFTVDLCATYDPSVERDGGGKKRIYPRGRTGMGLMGINPWRIKLPKCKKRRCPMVVKGTVQHKRVLKRKRGMSKEQEVVKRHHGSRLPLGLFHKILEEHEEWRADEGKRGRKCSVCAKREETSRSMQCMSKGCGRVQHVTCSVCKDMSRWKCDTCQMEMEVEEGRRRIEMAEDRGPQQEAVQRVRGDILRIHNMTMHEKETYYKVKIEGVQRVQWVTAMDCEASALESLRVREAEESRNPNEAETDEAKSSSSDEEEWRPNWGDCQARGNESSEENESECSEADGESSVIEVGSEDQAEQRRQEGEYSDALVVWTGKEDGRVYTHGGGQIEEKEQFEACPHCPPDSGKKKGHGGRHRTGPPRDTWIQIGRGSEEEAKPGSEGPKEKQEEEVREEEDCPQCIPGSGKKKGHGGPHKRKYKEYRVEEILGEQPAGEGKVEYKVRWEGYGAEYDSWEPEENLGNNEALRRWRHQCGRQESSRMGQKAKGTGKRGNHEEYDGE